MRKRKIEFEDIDTVYLGDHYEDSYEDENEIEIVESEIFKDQNRDKNLENTRRGMIKAVTEDFFSKLLKIAGDEEKIEENEK